MAKRYLNFRYSDSNKSPINKTQMRNLKIYQITNVAILYDFIEDYIFTESDWSEEDEAPAFNIYILDIYKKTELIDDDNNFFKWVSKYFLMILYYWYELRRMVYNHIIKNNDIFS